MANIYVITSTNFSIVFEVNGRAATFNREGELRAVTTDLNGPKVSIFDERALIEPKYRIPFDVILGTDSINVNGETVFADAKALIEVLRTVFFSEGLILSLGSKFGRNSNIGTATTPEDIWNGGGPYTGFNCTEAQTLEFFSSSVQDKGLLVSSGAATGGSQTTLVDSGATFISDGVLVGQLVIIDDQQIHGIIASVDSETEVSVFDFSNGTAGEESVIVGDAYRIAKTDGTGAAVCKFSKMLDESYVNSSEYVIMNGTTAVDSLGTYLRQSRGQVILAGSSFTNQGTITGRQKVTTANVTMVMPLGSGQTAICCDTVPSGEVWTVYQLNISMARASGTAGSAQAKFQTRKKGEAWQTKNFPEISSSFSYSDSRGSSEQGGVECTQFTDIRWSIESVSDNNTIVSASFDYRITKYAI